MMLCGEMKRREMVTDFKTFCSVFYPEGGGAPWILDRVG